jgi:hypothetical protein
MATDDDEPTQQPDDQPADDQPSDDQPSEESADQPTESSDEQPSDTSGDDQPTDESTDQPVESSDEQPSDTSGDDQPTDESTDQPAESSDDQPTDDSGDQGSQSDDTSTGDTDQSAQRTDASPALADAPTRPYGVESWRPLVTEMAGDIPVEVLLRWIKHESGGNPCSTGKIVNGASIENGLFQLYSPDDDHFATPAQLHGSFCSGQNTLRDLTLEEARIQVASGIAYVRLCRERARAQLKKGNVSWDETGRDFWSLVKMQHNLPSVPQTYIPKLRPASWSEFKAGALKEHPEYGKTTIFSNAEDIGAAAG